MKRRKFLGSLVAIPLATKTILSNDISLEQKSIKTKKPTIEYYTDVEKEFVTRYFFDYLKRNKPKFKYKRVYSVLNTIDGKAMSAKSRKMRALVFGCRDLKKVDTSLLDAYMNEIVAELEQEFKIINLKKFYFYQLYFTPIIYDPETFEPRRGTIIRYIRK